MTLTLKPDLTSSFVSGSVAAYSVYYSVLCVCLRTHLFPFYCSGSESVKCYSGPVFDPALIVFVVECLRFSPPSIISIFRLLSSSFMEAALLGHTNRCDELTAAEHLLDSQTAPRWLVIWRQSAEPTEQRINISLFFFYSRWLFVQLLNCVLQYFNLSQTFLLTAAVLCYSKCFFFKHVILSSRNFPVHSFKLFSGIRCKLPLLGLTAPPFLDSVDELSQQFLHH